MLIGSGYFALVTVKNGKHIVTFPDIPGMSIEASGLDDALDSAREALANYPSRDIGLPPARALDAIQDDPLVKEAVASGSLVMFVKPNIKATRH